MRVQRGPCVLGIPICELLLPEVPNAPVDVPNALQNWGGRSTWPPKKEGKRAQIPISAPGHHLPKQAPRLDRMGVPERAGIPKTAESGTLILPHSGNTFNGGPTGGGKPQTAQKSTPLGSLGRRSW